MGKISDMKNDPIKLELAKRGINPDKVLEAYSMGRSRKDIRIRFGINKEQLDFIIQYYGAKEIEKIRKLALDKWKGISIYNPLGQSKEKNQNNDNKRITLKDAINIVEGEQGDKEPKEEGDER